WSSSSMNNKEFTRRFSLMTGRAGDLLHKTHTRHTVLSQSLGKLTLVHAGAVGAVLPLAFTARRGQDLVLARLAGLSRAGRFMSALAHLEALFVRAPSPSGRMTPCHCAIAFDPSACANA
ncbi:MAG: hypothetical protein EB147_10010, partial [Acidimicrobiia bacterium]|nr:hypothetical protein [Acidimicrobiia bacterium]